MPKRAILIQKPSPDLGPSLTPQQYRIGTCSCRWCRWCHRWGSIPWCRVCWNLCQASGNQYSRAETVTGQHLNLCSPLHRPHVMKCGARDISPCSQSCKLKVASSHSVDLGEHRWNPGCGYSISICLEVVFIPVILGIFPLNATMKDPCLKCLTQQQLLLWGTSAFQKWSLPSTRCSCNYSECIEMGDIALCEIAQPECFFTLSLQTKNRHSLSLHGSSIYLY